LVRWQVYHDSWGAHANIIIIIIILFFLCFVLKIWLLTGIIDNFYWKKYQKIIYIKKKHKQNRFLYNFLGVLHYNFFFLYLLNCFSFQYKLINISPFNFLKKNSLLICSNYQNLITLYWFGTASNMDACKVNIIACIFHILTLVSNFADVY
jgi:hypothetical protein